MIKPIYWSKNSLFILNQKKLPWHVHYIKHTKSDEVARSIKDMIVRGAPLIGITAAYAIALSGFEKEFKDFTEFNNHLLKTKEKLLSTRPTAVNLKWALDRMLNCIASKYERDIKTVRKYLVKEAIKIHKEDIELNKKIGFYGSKLIKKNAIILTHCNAGALATGGYGTALGIIKECNRQKKIKIVYVDETRPYLQGARLTAWELKKEKIPFKIICDNMAGYIMKTEKINAVIVGADRIALNGDTANKIGTYSLAILAKYHSIPFYVAAPYSTLDMNINSGKEIPVEERSSKEVIEIFSRNIAPDGSEARHPAFDITPGHLITAIITEKGVFKPYNLRKKYKN